MLEKIGSIKKSLDTGNYLAALALALSIPDICGQVEYPNLSGKGHTGERYKKWFDNYIFDDYNATGASPFYNPNIQLGKNGLTLKELIPPDFTSDDCYQLRCAVLHSGNTDMDLSKVNFQRFKIVVDKDENAILSGVNYTFGQPTKDAYVHLNLLRFCNIICEKAEQCYNNHKSEFNQYHINIEIVDNNKTAI